MVGITGAEGLEGNVTYEVFDLLSLRCVWDIKIETQCEVERMDRGGRNFKREKPEK